MLHEIYPAVLVIIALVTALAVIRSARERNKAAYNMNLLVLEGLVRITAGQTSACGASKDILQRVGWLRETTGSVDEGVADTLECVRLLRLAGLEKQISALLIKNLIGHTDWKLFREQKAFLVENSGHDERADGLLSFLDKLQDIFVKGFDFSEEEIFGKYDEAETDGAQSDFDISDLNNVPPDAEPDEASVEEACDED